MRQIAAVYILLILSNIICSQTLLSKDSLLKLLPIVKQDTNAVLLYNKIGGQYEGNDIETAKQYYRMAGDLSKKIGYTQGVISYINNYTFLLNIQGNYDSSILLNLQAVGLAKKMHDSLNLGKSLFNTGTAYKGYGDFEKATAYYQEGKKVLEKLGRHELESHMNSILQLLYYEMKEYNKAIEYGEKAVFEFRKIKDTVWLATSLINLGIDYISLRKFDKAISLFNEALPVAIRINDKQMQIHIFLNLGDINFQLGEYEKMKFYFEKALRFSKEMKMHETEITAANGMSHYYTFKKQYNLAENFAKDALELSYKFNLRILRAEVFTQLSNLAYASQNIPSGEHYAKQGQILNDSLLNETIQKKTLELEKKYETEKKELSINKLEAEEKVQQLSIRQKSMLNYILLGSLMVLLIVGFMFYRNLRHRQLFAKQQGELQQQQIRELEKDKQLVAVDSMLKGQEDERSRLAKDLHDGLGSMLSGVKFSLMNMKSNLIISHENVIVFERSLDMLDTSIKELRRVAHNMMPEALVKFGLDEALKDYFDNINNAHILHVQYQFFGMEQRFEHNTEIIIYRIIQELFTNIFKHANASEVLVQLLREENRLSITVEDNGKGFDISELEKSKGAGWANIRSRVDYLKGELDLHSDSDKGTSVNIEINI